MSQPLLISVSVGLISASYSPSLFSPSIALNSSHISHSQGLQALQFPIAADLVPRSGLNSWSPNGNLSC